MPLICLTTPGHISSTPRLVKEADALVEAGYRVHVVSGGNFAPAREMDQAMVSAAKWEHTALRYAPLDVAVRKIAREAARRLFAFLPRPGVRLSACAQHEDTLRLANAAAGVGADYYIGHCLGGLAAAALAAEKRGVPFGFDVEDFHDAETTDASGLVPRLSRRLQGALLPGCRHVTASSPLIAARIRETYAVASSVVLNVFPLSHAPRTPAEPAAVSAQRPARLYWFSQTIGPGRGLEGVLRAMGRMRTPAVLQLRGFVSPDYAAQLRELAKQSGVGQPIEFLPSGAPDEMARLAAQADLGLSVEESVPLNRDLCLTNKIFTYLLAGIPQLLSRTSAQAALAPGLGAAALLADLADPAGTAAALDDLLGSRESRFAACDAARRLARERYCWDVEKEIFLSSIHKAAGTR